MSLSANNGAARERSRAFLDGWQVADRLEKVIDENGRPWRYLDLDVEPKTPVNGVLLACFLRGMWSRWDMRTDLMEDHLETA